LNRLLKDFDNALHRFSLLILSVTEAEDLSRTEKKDITDLFIDPSHFKDRITTIGTAFSNLCNDEKTKNTVKKDLDGFFASLVTEQLAHYSLPSEMNPLLSKQYIKIIKAHQEKLACLLTTFEEIINTHNNYSSEFRSLAKKIIETLSCLKKKIESYRSIHFKLNEENKEENKNNLLSIPWARLKKSNNLLSELFIADSAAGGKNNPYDLSYLKMSPSEIKTLSLFFESNPQNFFELPYIKAELTLLKLENKDHHCPIFPLLKNLRYFADSSYSQTLCLFLEYLEKENPNAYDKLRKAVHEENDEDFAHFFQTGSNPTDLTHQIRLDFKERFECLRRAPLVHELQEVTSQYFGLEKNSQQAKEIAAYYSHALRKDSLPLMTTGFHHPKNPNKLPYTLAEEAEKVIQQYFAAYQEAILQFDKRVPLVIKGTHQTFLIEYLKEKDSDKWCLGCSGITVYFSRFSDLHHYLKTLTVLHKPFSIQAGPSETVFYNSINPFLLFVRPFVAVDEEKVINTNQKTNQKKTKDFLTLWKKELANRTLEPKRLCFNNQFILELDCFLLNLSRLKQQQQNNTENEKEYLELATDAEQYLAIVNDPTRTYALNTITHIKRLTALNRAIETLLIEKKSPTQKKNALDQSQKVLSPVEPLSLLKKTLSLFAPLATTLTTSYLLPLISIAAILLLMATASPLSAIVTPFIILFALANTTVLSSRVSNYVSRKNRDLYSKQAANCWINKIFSKVKQIHENNSNNLAAKTRRLTV